MMEAADTNERGLEVSLFDPNLGVEPYGYPGERDSHPPPRFGVRKTAYLGWEFEYDLSELGAFFTHREEEPFPCVWCETGRRWERMKENRRTARRAAFEGWIACVRCRTPFPPSRSDNVYCSKGCRVKGARLGRARIDELLAGDSWMRRCQAPDCEESVIGMREGTRFHSTTCRVRAAYHQGGKDRAISGVSQA